MSGNLDFVYVHYVQNMYSVCTMCTIYVPYVQIFHLDSGVVLVVLPKMPKKVLVNWATGQKC